MDGYDVEFWTLIYTYLQKEKESIDNRRLKHRLAPPTQVDQMAGAFLPSQRVLDT